MLPKDLEHQWKRRLDSKELMNLEWNMYDTFMSDV
jgi:hypothetical protein